MTKNIAYTTTLSDTADHKEFSLVVNAHAEAAKNAGLTVISTKADDSGSRVITIIKDFRINDTTLHSFREALGDLSEGTVIEMVETNEED